MTSVNDGKLIEPRTLKGFRDFLPDMMSRRERLIDTARRIYRSFGFQPIDTPALEYLEILTGKGGDETDRQLYRFEDHGGRKIGMRFDLTVPLARFVAQHGNKLGTPFKRYHIATVWRGENTQRGRFREFMQCDFDTIGTLSIAADIEMVLVIHDLMQALGISAFTIHVNNRKVLNGVLEKLGVLDSAVAVLRSLDKLSKIGREKVIAELTEVAGLDATRASQVLDFAEMTGPHDTVLSQLGDLVRGSQLGEEGVKQLDQLFDGVLQAGISGHRLNLDVSIARGLDYYTGTIVETFLDHLPRIGSVCSGGRYDNLAQVYTKQKLPGIGASLGLDRLLAAMEELQLADESELNTPVFIPFFDSESLGEYLRLASVLRRDGIGVEVYPEPKKLGQQLKYAGERGFRVALIRGADEFARGTCQVKNLKTRSSTDVNVQEDNQGIVHAVQLILADNED